MTCALRLPQPILRGMCTWLRQQPGAESDPAMPPTNLVHLMDQHYLSVDDRIELGGWVELLAQAEPATASRATVIRQVLNLPDDWAERCHAVLSRLGQHQPPLTVARLLEDPPLAVIEALTTLVATERDQVRPTRHQLRGLHSIIYAHPDDRALLGTFQALPGVDTFMSWFLDSFAKREQLKLLATGFQVTESSLPSLFRCYREACDILQVELIPKFFIAPGAANAYTMGGADDACVVATTALVDLLDHDELLFVLGHELGHAKAGHAKYHTLARYLRYAAEEFARFSMGLTKTLEFTLGPTLYAWYRRSELTSDRAGLLACQDREAALRAMTKMAGFPASAVSELRVQSILDQAARYEQQMGDHAFYRLLELKDSLALTHPYWIIRARELQNWVDDGCYDEIVEASEAERRAMQGWVAEDPQLQVVATAASQALIAWAAAHWGVPKTMAGPIIRHMIYAQQPPDGTPLETLLRTELHISKQGANDIAYTVYALVHRDGKPVLIPIPVPLDSSWERVPRALREEFIRNGSSQLVRVLYTVPTHPEG